MLIWNSHTKGGDAGPLATVMACHNRQRRTKRFLGGSMKRKQMSGCEDKDDCASALSSSHVGKPRTANALLPTPANRF